MAERIGEGTVNEAVIWRKHADTVEILLIHVRRVIRAIRVITDRKQ